MPHIIVKLYSGRSEQQKAKLAEVVTNAVMASLGSDGASISVGIQDVKPEEWVEKVYKPDIQDSPETIYKKPGYNPL